MRSRKGWPLVLGCMVLLIFVRLHLKFRGFGKSIAVARRLGAGPRSAVPEADEAVVRGTLDALATAAAFFPGRAVCLEQSLGLYILLRRRGIPADLRIGVVPLPFSAHAWVEVRGVPVGENPDFLAGVLPFPEFA
ncbi:MAG TPA: lasso peptide biosynthesis B2 protein [Longimicrobiaceae bacterium]|nr:lasso peptide biosynthesis B2 protein [Longimicrobiaceae bacterium]